jgi:hypothetical protein
MTQAANTNPHDARIGDVYEDLDLGRARRKLKVVEIEGARAHVMNVSTERLTKISLDRLAPRSNGSHGYRRVERGPRADGRPDAANEVPSRLVDSGPGPGHVEASLK